MADEGLIASVKQRLINESRATGVPNEILTRRYAFERLLLRMVETGHRERFCLKGAMAFAAVTGDKCRPTRDMDFTGLSPTDPDGTLEIWRSIARHAPSEADGLTFLTETFKVEAINIASQEAGARIEGMAKLGNMRVPLKIEVSHGHALTPGAVRMEYPTILEGFKSPEILCYSPDTMLAEKFEAACSLGTRTSRFKDFYDIRGLARTVNFDGEVLGLALRNTFDRRGTPLPETDPDVFKPDFEGEGQQGWRNFLRKQTIQDDQSFSDLVTEIRPLVMQAAAVARGVAEPLLWTAGVGWAPVPGEIEEVAPEAEEGGYKPF